MGEPDKGKWELAWCGEDVGVTRALGRAEEEGGGGMVSDSGNSSEILDEVEEEEVALAVGEVVVVGRPSRLATGDREPDRERGAELQVASKEAGGASLPSKCSIWPEGFNGYLCRPTREAG